LRRRRSPARCLTPSRGPPPRHPATPAPPGPMRRRPMPRPPGRAWRPLRREGFWPRS